MRRLFVVVVLIAAGSLTACHREPATLGELLASAGFEEPEPEPACACAGDVPVAVNAP